MSAVKPWMPDRVDRLPRDGLGRPVPWFVATLPDGTRDPRIADPQKLGRALRENLCWVCGQTNGAHKAFLIGPMCAVNKISAEPPSHRDCAVFSAQACPFLACPQMRRRTTGLPSGGLVDPGGVMIRRNPGVSVVWMTKTFRLFQPAGGGVLLALGDPSRVAWFTQGRPATRQEAHNAMITGLPILREACQRDDNPAAALRQLDAQFMSALALLPAA